MKVLLNLYLVHTHIGLLLFISTASTLVQATIPFLLGSGNRFLASFPVSCLALRETILYTAAEHLFQIINQVIYAAPL